MARPPKETVVSKRDREELEGWLRAGNTPKKLAERAQILLGFADGETSTEIAERLGLSRNAVYRWRSRYEREGLEALQDRSRPGRPRSLPKKKAREILSMTVERIPREATHWSLRLMAKYAGVTVHQVREVWRGADLKPHRLRSFKISTDPNFAEKVQDVVGLYLDPPDNAMVLSVDEKTQIQAHRLRRHLQHADALLPFRRAFGLRDWGPLVSRDTRARPPAVPLSSGAGEAPPPAARMADQITFGQRVNVGLQYAGDRLAQGALQEEPGRSPVGRGRPYVWRMPSTVREVRSIEFGPGAFLLAGIDLSSVRPCDLVREHLSIGRKAGAFNLSVRVLEPGSDQRLGTMEKRFFHRHLQGGEMGSLPLMARGLSSSGSVEISAFPLIRSVSVNPGTKNTKPTWGRSTRFINVST